MNINKNFRLRASGGGQLMGSRGLGKTGFSYIQNWLKEQIYGRRNEIRSKYLTKGLEMEDEAIDFISKELFDGALLFKNEEFFRNDYLTGTPDLIYNNSIIDIKCSWDAFTFPLFENDIPNKDYYYQMQVYMELTGLDRSEVIYCLMNTPEDLIYESDLENHNFDNVDTKHRIKRFEVLKDNEVIEKMKSRVIEAREYIKSL